ncbi:hypothetical protein OKW31_003604 [Paraburkholderia atlantica]
MSFKRTIAAPPLAARTMMLSNCDGSASRPVVVTANDCCTAEPVGDCPMLPTANCWFWFETTFCTSAAVTPSCAIRSGFNHIRIA